MPKACELGRGEVVAIGGAPHMLEELRVTTPSARGASSLYHLRFRNLVTKAKVDHTVKGEEMYPPMDFERRLVQYLFRDRDVCTFMDTENFSQFELLAEDIEEQLEYLVEDREGIYALLSEGKVLAIELPPSIDLTVKQCDPSMRSASATARQKNAILETGMHILVPEYIEEGELVRVDTRTGKFMSRA